MGMSEPVKYGIALGVLVLIIGGIVAISGPGRADVIVRNGSTQPITLIQITTFSGGDAIVREPLAVGQERRVPIIAGEEVYDLRIRFSDGRFLDVEERYVQSGDEGVEVVSDSAITRRIVRRR